MGLPWEPTKGPKAKKLAEARFRQLSYQAWIEGDDFAELKKTVPDAWSTLEMDFETDAPKEKMTLYLDRAVAKMFRGMGQGYQARINRVLETWLQWKIAEMWRLEKDMDEMWLDAQEDASRSEDGDEVSEHIERMMDRAAWRNGFEAGQKAAAETG